MLFVPKDAFIYLYGLPVDLRKGCEGLASISSSLVNEVSSEAYFIFLNRKRNRVKILYWTPANLSYYFLRSRKGVFAPKAILTSVISQADLKCILRGDFPCHLRLKNC
jgi:hypothetical protein